MAITTASNMSIHNDVVRNAYAEKMAQVIDSFFANSRGAVVIEDAAVPGDYLSQSFFKFPSGLVTRRVTTGTGYDGTPTPITIEQGDNKRVRLARKLGPVEITFDAMRKIASNEAEFSRIVGDMMAEAVSAKMLSDSAKALVAALNRSPYVKDISSATVSTVSRTTLAAALALMGDRASDVVCWVMHSKPYFDLIAADLNTSSSVDSLIANVALYGGSPGTLGKPVIVTDEASLILDETTDKYYTLGLTAGAVRLQSDTQLADVVGEIVTGGENLRYRIQGERDWFLGLKGFQWDSANGGANPSDTALATANNWDAVSSDAKLRAGVCIKST